MLRSLILLVSLAAVGLALAIVAAGPGTRFGLWDYGTGLLIIRTVALPVLIAAGLSGFHYFRDSRARGCIDGATRRCDGGRCRICADKNEGAF
jgi:hypothetical protein